MGSEKFKVVHISELSIKAADRIITMTKQEWLENGTKLFGPDMMKWKFICPCCGHVQAVEDFFPYKDKGASPDSATHDCIGRYDGHMHVNMGEAKPCNYSGYGLFDFCPILVLDKGEELRCFAFYEGAP